MRPRPASSRLIGWARGGLLALFGVLAVGPDAAAATKAEVMRMVADEAARNGRVPVALALAVARVESNFDDHAISSAGARGVMQILPSSFMADFAVTSEQLMEPRVNVRLGLAVLERLHDQYGQDWELALSHYNGGNLRSNGGHFIAHDYTRRYVAEVTRWLRFYQRLGTGVVLAAADANPKWTWQIESRNSPGEPWPARLTAVAD